MHAQAYGGETALSNLYIDTCVKVPSDARHGLHAGRYGYGLMGADDGVVATPSVPRVRSATPLSRKVGCTVCVTVGLWLPGWTSWMHATFKVGQVGQHASPPPCGPV